MKSRNTSLIVAAAAVLLMAVPAFAWMGGRGPCGGSGDGPGWQGPQGAELSAEQQAQVKAVEAKYQPRFDTLKGQMDAKQTQTAKALANDKTTVAELDKLQAEMFDLHQAAQKLRFTQGQELRKITGFGPGMMGFGAGGCGGPCDGSRDGYHRGKGRHGMMDGRWQQQNPETD